MLPELFRSLQEMFIWTNILVFLFIFLATWFIYKVIIHPTLSPLNKIPGERDSLLFGMYVKLMKDRDLAGIYEKKMKNANSDIFRVHGLFGMPVVAVANNAAYKYVSVLNNKNYPKPEERYKPLINVIGNGLVTLNGQEHQTRRKLCMGAFKYSFLKSLVGKISQHGAELVDIWDKQLSESTDNTINVEIIKDLSRAALDAIIDVVLDHKSTILQDPNSPMSQAFEHLVGNVGVTDLVPLYKLLPTPGNLRFKKHKILLDKTVFEMVEKKRSLVRDSADDVKVDNLLSMLMLAKDEENGKGLSDEQLHQEVLTFLFAGHETTSSALMWCLYSLACNQDIQQKLREEILSVSSSEDMPLTGHQLESMSYLFCVIKEALRYHNVAAGGVRKSLKDDHIGGYFIPKGSLVYLSLSNIHMNPENWEEPNRFNPERFLDESKIKPFSFVPFSSGPRMCIGYKFAYLEMQVFLTYLLRKFEFHLTPGMENMKKEYFLTARSAQPIILKMTRVK